MATNNPFGGEGSSINRPPLFSGEGYAYWKVRMRIFIEAIDIDIWGAIENGPYVPKKNEGENIVVIPKESWSSDDKRKVSYDLKAKNIITSALSYDEFFRVSQCKNAKEMWDTLQVTHEGTSEVRRARLNTLMHEFELFRMFPNESISNMQMRFTHILNALIALGKTFIDGEIINKVLRCLDRSWQPKVTAIMESKDLDTMDLATLFGKLQEHEMELNRLHLNEESDKDKDYKKKGIALKATKSRSRSHDSYSQDDEDSDDDSSDDEDMRVLMKKFKKFLKNNKGRDSTHKMQHSTDSHHKSKPKESSIICHECKKPGHIRPKCPRYLKKMEKEGKYPKVKRAYITWDEPKQEAQSSSSEDEVARICLMAQHHSEQNSSYASSNESDGDQVSDSENSFAYELLYNAYEEMHEEFKKLAKKYKERKKILVKHQQEILELQKHIEMISLDNETLHLIIDNSSCDCASKLNNCDNCENCKVLKNEISILKSELANFNLDKLLANQRDFGDTTGLGYTKPKKKSFRKVGAFSNVNFNKHPTCFYCGIFGHKNNICKIKTYGVPIGKYVWIAKEKDPIVFNFKGSKTSWVPKSSK